MKKVKKMAFGGLGGISNAISNAASNVASNAPAGSSSPSTGSVFGGGAPMEQKPMTGSGLGFGAAAPAQQSTTGIGLEAANRVAQQFNRPDSIKNPRGEKQQFEKIGGNRNRDSRMLQNFGKNTLPPGIDQNIPTMPKPQVLPADPDLVKYAAARPEVNLAALQSSGLRPIAPPQVQQPQVFPQKPDFSSIPGFTDWQNKNQQLQQLQQNFMQQNYGTQIAKMQDYGRQIQQLQPNSPEANRLIQEADQYSRQYLPQMTQQMQTQFGDQMQELGKLQASMQPAMQQWQQQWQPQVQQQQPTAGSGLAGFGAPQGVMYKKGGKVKKMANGGVVKKSAPKASSASKRGDGIAQRGKTRGRMV